MAATNESSKPELPYDYCLKKSAPEGSDFYYCTLFLDARAQRLARIIMAWYLEISEIPEECSEASVAEIKMQWWQDEHQRIRAQSARHPVGIELQSFLQEFNFQQDHFDQVFEHANNRVHSPDRYKVPEISLIWRMITLVNSGTSDEQEWAGENAALIRTIECENFYDSTSSNSASTYSAALERLAQIWTNLPDAKTTAILPSMIKHQITLRRIKKIRRKAAPVDILPLTKLWVAWKYRK